MNSGDIVSIIIVVCLLGWIPIVVLTGCVKEIIEEFREK